MRIIILLAGLIALIAAATWWTNARSERRLAEAEQEMPVLREQGERLLLEGDASGALTAFQDSLGYMKYISGADSNNPTLKTDLCRAHLLIARAATTAGDSRTAMKHLQTAVPLIDEVIALDPIHPDWLAVRREVFSELSTALENQDRIAAALQRRLEVLEIDRQFMALEPWNENYRRALAATHGDLARMYASEGKEGEAEQHRIQEQQQLEKLQPAGADSSLGNGLERVNIAG